MLLYRALLPTPVWYRFFLNKEYGSLFSSLMTGLYLTFKLTSVVEKVRQGLSMCGLLTPSISYLLPHPVVSSYINSDFQVQSFFAALKALSRKEVHYGAYATTEQVVWIFPFSLYWSYMNDLNILSRNMHFNIPFHLCYQFNLILTKKKGSTDLANVTQTEKSNLFVCLVKSCYNLVADCCANVQFVAQHATQKHDRIFKTIFPFFFSFFPFFWGGVRSF